VSAFLGQSMMRGLALIVSEALFLASLLTDLSSMIEYTCLSRNQTQGNSDAASRKSLVLGWGGNG